VAAAEDALHIAYADREQARRDRSAARQAHERASATAERLQRRVREMREQLGQMLLCPSMIQIMFVSVF
jgi:selenocysteine lyase/cysteine desulfurase